MIQKRIFGIQLFDRRIYFFAAAIGMLFVFDMLAIYLSLYYHYRWIDIPVHATGGFLLAALFFYIVFSNKVTKSMFGRIKDTTQVFTVSVFWVFVVAFLWEVFELIIGRTSIRLSTTPDMFADIIVTTVGAGMFYLIYKTIRMKKSPQVESS